MKKRDGTGSDSMGTTYQDFLEALRIRESADDYQVVNTLGFLGAYQFGEAALVDLGFVNVDANLYDNDFSGGFTGKFSVNSVDDFLQSPSVQDSAADEWFELLWSYSVAVGLDHFLGHSIGGAVITASGILAGVHLLGTGAALEYLESGGTTGATDQYGTPVAEYIALFAGYTMPFPTEKIEKPTTDRITECPLPEPGGNGDFPADGLPSEVQPFTTQTGSALAPDTEVAELLDWPESFVFSVAKSAIMDAILDSDEIAGRVAVSPPVPNTMAGSDRSEIFAHKFRPDDIDRKELDVPTDIFEFV